MADRNGYIGRSPSDSSITVARQTNQPTSSTSTFVFNSGYNVGYLDVYVNGSKLVNALDYQATDTQNVILTTPAENGDVVEFVAYKAFNLSNVITSANGDFTVSGDITADNGTFSGDLTASNGTFSGIVTAVSFIGNGSQLTGIDATSLKDGGGDIKVQANTSGAVVTGILTATSFSGSGANLTDVISGVELQQSGSTVGSSITAINFSGATVSTPVAGLSTVTIAKQLTIGVRTGTAVTFGVVGSSFNVPNRAGGNVPINI